MSDDKVDMTTWQQVDDYLGRPFSDDFRSDYMFEQVTALMEKLTTAEFTVLRSTWPHRSPEWQTRCADTLPWVPMPRREIVSVLLEMVQSQNDDLTISAADTLREFDPAMVAAAVTPEMMHRLREVAHRHPGLSAGAIQRLLDGLSDERGSL